jgi:hypothetical protein
MQFLKSEFRNPFYSLGLVCFCGVTYVFSDNLVCRALALPKNALFSDFA